MTSFSFDHLSEVKSSFDWTFSLALAQVGIEHLMTMVGCCLVDNFAFRAFEPVGVKPVGVDPVRVDRVGIKRVRIDCIGGHTGS